MKQIGEGARAPRDPRLDFFRGIGMFIILVAHIPWNPWTNWIPARFGFSDAADLFVFCSGMASALAFATIFDRNGLLLGGLRILHRVWQVYWAHIGGFFVVLGLIASAD
ncbi:MAG: OpgC domain-containing protein, partial [Hyphomicrobiales bacterium]|nr:OpgC domain-containing protein [Hyphomicrobiales bacterium]